MKRNLAPETKTAGAGAAAALATIVFVLNGWLHWFTPPPADVVVALSGAFSTLVGYVLPHTSRTPAVQPPTGATVTWHQFDPGTAATTAATTTGGAS